GRGEDGREGPGEKAVRGVAEVGLVHMDADPFGAQAARDVAAERGRHHGHEDQTDPAGETERRAGRALSGPWTDGHKTEPGDEFGEKQAEGAGRDPTGRDGGPGDGGLAGFVVKGCRFDSGDGDHETFPLEAGVEKKPLLKPERTPLVPARRLGTR